jgi:hypothetical protein
MLKALTLAEGTERCGLVYARRESEAATSGSAMMPDGRPAPRWPGRRGGKLNKRIPLFGEYRNLENTGIWRIQEFGQYE